MPAFVKSRFGESGIKLEEGTRVWLFSWKKSRNDWRICADVIKNQCVRKPEIAPNDNPLQGAVRALRMESGTKNISGEPLI